MKRETGIIILLLVVLSLTGCTTYDGGELRGAASRSFLAEPTPYNMVRLPRGSFVMGRNDQDVTWAHRAPAKTVTLEAFWMDQTEISNTQYRQFVEYVRDSLMRERAGEANDEYWITETGEGNEIEDAFGRGHILNWDIPLDLGDEDVAEAIKGMYYDENDQFPGKKEIDTRKLLFKYSWIDLKQAADFHNRWDPYLDSGRYGDDAEVYKLKENKYMKVENRQDFIISDEVFVYPDTLAWISDFSYSFNEPMAKNYFWHPAYDNYPVVGVKWTQAFAFCRWRTDYLNRALNRRGEYPVHDFRLPTEAEWEYAARGGLSEGMYPWGSYYPRSAGGCLLANFKPMRGRYADDGGSTTLPVTSFEPNDYGLYNMSGNVAEWTSSAYDESSYYFTHDLNPDYQYHAHKDDPPAMKRKVIRGGSWKDVSFFMQVGTRAYEYQDSSATYIGFRCVRSCMLGDEIR